MFYIGFIVAAILIFVSYEIFRDADESSKMGVFRDAVGGSLRAAFYTGVLTLVACILIAPSFLGITFLSVSAFVTVAVYAFAAFLARLVFTVVGRVFRREKKAKFAKAA